MLQLRFEASADGVGWSAPPPRVVASSVGALLAMCCFGVFWTLCAVCCRGVFVAEVVGRPAPNRRRWESAHPGLCVQGGKAVTSRSVVAFGYSSC